MKALVTGATGFVGSHVVRALLDAGHSVRALHRTSSKLDALAGLPYESALGDVTDLDALRAACAGCDWVFHVAAVADYWRADKDRMMHVNVEGTRWVLQAAREAGVKRVVFTSSAAAVGLRADGTLSDETDAFNLPPDQFPYAFSKALAEDVVREAVEAGQDVVIVNPVVVLGPGDLNIISGDFVLKVKRLSWTIPVPPGGIAVIDVRDAARYHLAAAEKGITGERYLLGTANYKTAHWFMMIADQVGAARPGLPIPAWALPLLANLFELLRKNGIELPVDGNQTRISGRDVMFDYTKTWNAFGKPQLTMRQSIDDTYRWYIQHGYIKRDLTSQIIDLIGRWW